MQLFAHEADQQIVVALVEPVALESQLVGVVRVAESGADAFVLFEDATLLSLAEPRKFAAATQRVADRPRPVLLHYGRP